MDEYVLQHRWTLKCVHNMNKCAKWKKSTQKWHVIWLHLSNRSGISKSTGTKSGLALLGLGVGRRNGEGLHNGYRVYLGGVEKVLEPDRHTVILHHK